MSYQEKQKRRFRHWVFLNPIGKKLYGTVFSDGMVPVVSMIPATAIVGGEEEKVYLVFHQEMSEDQISNLVKLLAEKFGAREVDVKNELLKNRIPLRAKYTEGAATDGLALFV
jgi:hypothetical protein